MNSDSLQNLQTDRENTERIQRAASLLAISVSEDNTRVLFFEPVENQYRLLGSVSTPVARSDLHQDVGQRALTTIEQLQNITGFVFLNDRRELIQPGARGKGGADNVVVTFLVGRPLKIVLAGLLEEISIDSAKKLIGGTYCKDMITIDLNALKNQASQLDQIRQLQPDLIIIAGGIDNGASESVIDIFETIQTACLLLPKEERPIILFAGNSALQTTIEKISARSLDVRVVHNIRPNMDRENLEAAQREITKIDRQIRIRQVAGLQKLDEWSQGCTIPSISALGRNVRFLSKARTPDKGVLGIDIGASTTSIAIAFDGELSLNVYPQLGTGADLSYLLEKPYYKNFTRWLTLELPDELIKAYILNKQFHPSSVPGTTEELAIEHALMRHLLRMAIQKMRGNLTGNPPASGADYLPWVEPILASGNFIPQSPDFSHSLLLLLDSLQPTGATTFVLDPYHALEALGAAAEINPTLSVQVLDSNAFNHLGTVISPVGKARKGTPILRAVMIDDDGYTTNIEIAQGTIERIPLPAGKAANLKLIPLHKFDVGMGGAGIGGTLRVKGGALGVIIDGRGRPISLPSDADQRYETLQNWSQTLEG